MSKTFNPIKRIALAFVTVSFLGSAAHAASALAAAVAGMAVVGVTVVGLAALESPVRDTLRHQAVSFRDGADRIPGKELTDLFVQVRKAPDYERYSDQELTEAVLAALDADPIQD